VDFDLITRAALAAACALLTLAPAHAAGDAKRGADVFAEECGDCHSAAPGKDKKGPSLTGVLGRKAGSVASFAAGYSEAMKASNIVWTAERIDAYITKPKKVVPAGTMKYDGLGDAAQRADVIAFVLSLK
jgi:cytochrome c